MDLLSLKEDIIKAGHELLTTGLVAGTWGNISCRTADQNIIAVTPSGRDYRSMVPEDVVIVDMAGSKLAGKLKPTSELPLHLAVYKRRSDVQAIVHTHSVFASACAVAGHAIPPIIEDLVQASGGSIEVAEYALPGTDALAANAIKALADKQAVLLANHGVIGCGATLTEAIFVCQLVEKAAQIYIYANTLGGAKVLSGEDVTTMRRFYLEYYRQRRGGEGS